MASSSSKQTSGSSRSNFQIKSKTMAIPFESFEVQNESPVDFASLKRNGMDLGSLIAVQELFPYFDMEAALDEEDKAMIRNPSLRGKTRQEMGLESFRQTEIRSAVMGIPITITEEVIAKACRVAPTGRFLWNITGKHPFMSSYTSVCLKGDLATKLVNIDNNHKMLLKFLTE